MAGRCSVSVKKRLFFLFLFPLASWAQLPGGGSHGSLEDGLHTIETKNWVIFGRTTDTKGNPLGGVAVRVDVGAGVGSVRALTTSLQGEFRTEFTLNADMYKRLRVSLIASKPGYAEANEIAEFGAADKTSGIGLVLRELAENPDQLSMATLVGTLAPRLHRDAARHSAIESGHKEFARGCEELIERHNAVGAVPLLSKAVQWTPSCVECRLLLTLALFEAGSWASATRQLEEVTKLNDAATSKRPEPALIAGVLEAWRGETSRSAGFFQKALEIDPKDALALQEMGRVLISQKNWEAADRNLEKALRAGAGDEARLLRVRALLEEGDIAEAGHEMDQYTAGRNLKTLPSEARDLYLQVQHRLSLEPYAKVRSVLNQSPQDLAKAIPELAGMPVTSDQTELEAVLRKVGEGVEAFLKNFPNTVSLEHVHQERLGKDGKVMRSLDQDFQYLLLSHADKWSLGIDELRTTSQGASTALGGLDQGLMLTGGFASVSMLFHPAYQDGAGFRYLGRQSSGEKEVSNTVGVQEVVKTSDGRKLLLKPDGTWTEAKEELPPGKGLHVIAFAQKPETARSTERFTTEDGSALILVQGLAWIDPTTFQIVRLRTDLLAPQPKLRLQRQTTEIQFGEVSFKEVATPLWLPREVSVTVELRGRVYRNSHRYSDFKLFNVETKENRKISSLTAKPDQ